MSTKVEKSILVNVPVGTAYNQWTQFEDFPQFMSGVKTVTQLTDSTMHWVAEIAGIKREWDAAILEQVPDVKVAWAATSGATNAGAVYFEPVSSEQTSVRLTLEYEPEGVVEKIGDAMNFIEKQAESDLEKFKTFIESERYATGAWRGGVNEGLDVGAPGVDAAAASQGDSGKSGFSAKGVLAAAAVAGAGIAVASAAKNSSSDSETHHAAPTGGEPVVDQVTVEEPVAVETAPVEPAGMSETAATSAVPPLSDTTGANPGGAASSYGTDQSGVAEDTRPDQTTGGTAGLAPVQGMPGLGGTAGAADSAGRYAAEDEAVTDLDEHHGDAGRMK